MSVSDYTRHHIKRSRSTKISASLNQIPTSQLFWAHSDTTNTINRNPANLLRNPNRFSDQTPLCDDEFLGIERPHEAPYLRAGNLGDSQTLQHIPPPTSILCYFKRPATLRILPILRRVRQVPEKKQKTHASYRAGPRIPGFSDSMGWVPVLDPPYPVPLRCINVLELTESMISFVTHFAALVNLFGFLDGSGRRVNYTLG